MVVVVPVELGSRLAGVGPCLAGQAHDAFEVAGGAGQGEVEQGAFAARGGDAGDGSGLGVGDAAGGERGGDAGSRVSAWATRRWSCAVRRLRPTRQDSQCAHERIPGPQPSRASNSASSSSQRQCAAARCPAKVTSSRSRLAVVRLVGAVAGPDGVLRQDLGRG